MRGKAHGTAGIDQQHQLAVGLALEALDVGAIRTGIHIPVHMAQVIPRRIRTVFGEFLTEAKVCRTVQAGDESIDHRRGHQVKP